MLTCASARPILISVALLVVVAALVDERRSLAEERGLTSLANREVRFTVPEKHYVVLRRGDVQAVIVDNAAVDDDVLRGHRAGYSGVASLTHKRRAANLFVPAYAGLNYEHIHDGTKQASDIIFEPRRAPMELRVVGPHVAELYQKPTPHWSLESVLRYQMLEDGVIEMTLECIPRKKTFRNGYIGLFWASYIHQPESLEIHFLGHEAESKSEPRWIRGVTPSHGVLATHLAADDQRDFKHDADFPAKLVFGHSKHRYAEPWYYGVSHGMAYVQMFRPQDRIRLTQSPSGGGSGNPAWDFQFFISDISDYEVGKLYRMVMRAMYVPFESREQIVKMSEPHRRALAKTGERGASAP
jgi:hypothetical protein